MSDLNGPICWGENHLQDPDFWDFCLGVTVGLSAWLTALIVFFR